MDTTIKLKKNLIMPVAPMFASIMTGPASHLVKKLCKVVNVTGETRTSIAAVKEHSWNGGPGNENLEMSFLDIGRLGMVVGIAEPKTVLRFLVASPTGNEEVDGIYHVSVLNLEPLEEES